MKVKRIIALLTSAVVLGTSAISASAVEYDHTELYYAYQQQTWGEVVLYPTYASGSTYCELMSANKFTYVTHCFQLEDDDYVNMSNGTMDFIYNGYSELSYQTNPMGKYIKQNRGARTKSGVKVTSYITWTSEGCEDNAQVGTVTAS